MQTLRELLATFPDPPKTLLNSKPGTGGAPVDTNASSGASAGSLSSLVVTRQQPQSMPAGLTPIAAGGGSAIATGFQAQDLAQLERSCRGELDGTTQREVFRKLLTEPVLPVERALDTAYTNSRAVLLKDLAAAKKKKVEKVGKESPFSAGVYTNKHFMDFGSHLAVGHDVEDVLELHNNSGTKIKYRIMCPSQDMALDTNCFALTISPLEGVLKKKETASIHFRIHTKSPGNVALVILLIVEGGLSFHVVIKQEIFA